MDAINLIHVKGSIGINDTVALLGRKAVNERDTGQYS
jgi:hypothetical protein